MSFSTNQVKMSNKDMVVLFTPVKDHDFLQMFPIDTILKGYFKGVPSLVGSNKHEGSVFALQEYPLYAKKEYNPHISLREFQRIVPKYLFHPTQLTESAAKQWYIDWSTADNITADHYHSFVQLETDQVLQNSCNFRMLKGKSRTGLT